MNTYQNDCERLLKDVVAADCVGGFMTRTADEETLYAVHHNGDILKRTAKRPNDTFAGKGWEKVDAVPADAEWIGQFRLPYAPKFFAGGNAEEELLDTALAETPAKTDKLSPH